MIPSILAGVLTTLCAALSPAPAVTPRAETATATTPVPRESRAAKALATWLKLYMAGKLQVQSPPRRQGRPPARMNYDSLAEKYGLCKNRIPPQTPLADLELILEHLVAQEDGEGARWVVTVAAVGVGPERYEPKLVPHKVRDVGEQALGKLKGDAAWQMVADIAAGKQRVTGKLATQAAALRGLGSHDDPAHRAILEGQLDGATSLLRLTAADGLRRMKSRASLNALAGALQKEANDAVLVALVDAARAVLGEPEDGVLPEGAGRLVHAAVEALGSGGWRADMAVTSFLSTYRSAEAVPALIDVLERFVDRDGDVKAGRLSPLLRYRAHETLVALTGAVFPAEAPEQWREFWEREKATFAIAKAAKETSQKGPGTVAKGFFGIPVEGHRVTFVLDVSGSMAESMPGGTVAGGGGDGGEIKMTRAKQELLKAIDGLPETTKFNVVTFNDRVDVWQKKLMPATKRSKAALRRWVEGVRAYGATNLWGGLEQGLKMKSLVYADRYESHVDELFVLSDGAPTFGSVQDPRDILRLVDETNRFSQVKINTVFIKGQRSGYGPGGAPGGRGRGQRGPGGPGDDDGPLSPEDLMRRMAKENGGKCVVLQ